VALFFRVFDKGLYVHAHKNTPEVTEPSINPSGGEAPLSMLLPAIFLALAILLIGIFNQFIVTNVILFAVPAGL
jgi:NADH:ubiquinone oxidoreductase subunit 5 (subunit L)/multisubunit Na+/H+ antiporter MnhA subunit